MEKPACFTNNMFYKAGEFTTIRCENIFSIRKSKKTGSSDYRSILKIEKVVVTISSWVTLDAISSF